jgi:phenylalanyl-tRNA synthetase beta chain
MSQASTTTTNTTRPRASSPESSSVFDSLKATLASALPSSSPKDLNIGVIGILHPSVLEKFDISFPCSALEITLEPFKKEIKDVWADDE